MAYNITLEEHPGYLHSAVTGDSTAENAARFLRETYAACVDRGFNSVLLEMNLTGASLEGGEIFKVIADGSASGKLLKRIAYVDQAERSEL